MSTQIQIASSSALEVGTTPVTSGTDSRVFFQAGGVVQQDSAFTFTQAQTALRIARSGTPSSPLLSLGNSTASAKAGLKIWNGSTTETNGAELFVNTDNNIYLKSNNANSIILASSTTNVLTISTNQASITRLNINGASTTPVFSVASEGTTSSNYPFYISGLASSKVNIMNGLGQFGINKPSNTLGANLDVSASGALSTDIAFRVRNSADTQNLISISGDGRIAIGLNAQILGTTDAFKNVVIGGLAKDISGAGVSENSVAVGYNAISNNGGTAIGANTQIIGNNAVAIGSGAIAGIDSIAIGVGARADATSGYQSLAIGRGARASALLSGIIAVGQSSYTNALGQTLAFCVDPSGANSQTMLLTNKANLVFKNSTQLTAGTHWNTTATNTLTIHNGTIPNGNIVDAIQFYSADIVDGNTAPHFRTENGDVIKLYKQTLPAVPVLTDVITLLTNLGLI